MSISAGPSGTAFVALTGLTRRFGGTVALRDFSLQILRGEIVALLGPSGCGKSTLLRVVAGLEPADAGSVAIEGHDLTGLPPYRRPVNLMFQSYALFPHMTVAQNVAFGLKQERLAREVIAERVARVLALVRMSGFRDRRPDQLSGGERQRVALARSLIKEPSLLLLDEPMAALDRKLRGEMQFEIAEILRRVRVTCLMVTHDPEEAMVMADRLAAMDTGTLVQEGPPRAVYERPVNRFVAGLLGEMNYLAGPRGPVALRPEHVRLAAPGSGDGLPAIVMDVAWLGAFVTWRARLPDGQFVLARSGTQESAGLEPGMPVTVTWDPAHTRDLPP